MKKLLVLLFLTMIGTSVYAQKRYAYISYSYTNGGSSPGGNIHLSGCIPTDMESYYSDANHSSVGTIIDELAQRGYVVEQLSNAGYTYSSSSSSTPGRYFEVVIMSISSTSPPGQTQIEGDVNNDSEVNIADVNKVISIILGMLRDNPKLLEQLGIVQPK